MSFDHAMKNISKAVVKEALPKSDVKELIDCATGISDETHAVQVFDSAAIASKTHVLSAYLNALLAFKNRTNRSKSVGMEMLLFVSLTDQIHTALEIAGAKPDSKVVVFASDAKAFSKAAPMLESVADFNPSSAHQSAVFKKLGIKNAGGAPISIMQAMAASRLGP
jgi:tRNA threonylcarbamoyladenosine modification (KEOPS) complex Cgi121 subunit